MFNKTARPGRFSKIGVSTTVCLLLVILLAVVVRVYCFRGFWGADDGEYARLANAMAAGHFNEFVEENYIRNYYGPAQIPGRIGLIFPVAMLFRHFGVSELMLIVYPLSISILSVVLAFLCGWLLFGVQAGLVAAAVWSVLPVDVSLATSLLPDAIASFYGSVGILLILFVMRTDKSDAWPRFFVGLVAGLFFGISWLTKESIFYLVPFSLVLLVCDARKNFKRALPLWLGVGIASGGILVGEMLVYYHMKGDFLLRLHETERNYVQGQSYLFYEGSRFGWPVGGSYSKALLKRLFLEGPSEIFLSGQFLFLPLIALLGMAHAVYWKDKKFFFPGLWMLSLVGMYNFASASFSSYTPLTLYWRYLHPIMLPAAVLAAGFVTELLTVQREAVSDNTNRTSERFFWGTAVASLLAIVSVHSAFRQARDTAHNPIFDTRKIASVVTPADRIYTDPLTSKALEFFWNYPKELRTINFEGMRTDAVEKNTFVLVDKFRLDWLGVNVGMWLTKPYGYQAPEFSNHPPASWKPVWQNRNATLYRVG